MASIVLGVAASHSTLMNTHWDKVVHTERAEAFRDGLAAARDRHRRGGAGRRGARRARTTSVGSGSTSSRRSRWASARSIAAGDGGTPKGPQKTDPEFAQALAQQLVDRGTEVAISARLQIDHGQAHAIQYLLDGIDVPVVPLVVNVFAAPLPTMPRVAELGANITRAVAEIGGDKRVVVIASGGLSHQLPWPSDWTDPDGDDEEFLVDAWLNGRGEWERFDDAAPRDHRRRRSPRSSPTSTRQFLADLEKGEMRQYAELTVRADRRAWPATAARSCAPGC